MASHVFHMSRPVHTGCGRRSSVASPRVFSQVNRGVNGSAPGRGPARRHTLSTAAVISSANLWITVRGHFHWVETTNPTAMKPKPTTMFQSPRAATGRLAVVT